MIHVNPMFYLSFYRAFLTKQKPCFVMTMNYIGHTRIFILASNHLLKLMSYVANMDVLYFFNLKPPCFPLFFIILLTQVMMRT